MVVVCNMKWIYIFTAACFIPMGESFYSSFYTFVRSKLDYEVCNEDYISPDFHRLRKDLEENLFGQNIVINKLVSVLESHFNVEPRKALVICMHGWTGSGKNYAVKFIIDAIYKKKSDSEFVRMFNGRLHFPIDLKNYVDQYKLNIQEWVKGNVTKCERSLFIFDEVDKVPDGVIDSIKPFFDYHKKIDSVDYRKSIFIFISNIGAQEINSQYMNLWRNGKSREDMEYKDFESHLQNALYKTEGGFKHSGVIEGHLVSLYLPFLPLQMKHVEKCVQVELSRQNIKPSENYITEVIDNMEFNSDGFSLSGCKRVADIVASIKYMKRLEEL